MAALGSLEHVHCARFFLAQYLSEKMQLPVLTLKRLAPVDTNQQGHFAAPKPRRSFHEDGAAPADLILAEGSMGLFDGVAVPGAAGSGASADVAALAGWPVVAVIDVSGQAQSAGAVALGMDRFRPGLRLAGVILNRVASARHAALARAGVEAAGLTVLGVLPRDKAVTVPERHLGLVQAAELPRLTALLADLGAFVAAHCDLDAIVAGVDIDTVITQVDLDAAVHQVDLLGLANEIIDGVNLPAIIRESTGAMSTDAVRSVRSRGVDADAAVSGFVDRLLGRAGADGQHESEHP